MRIAVGLLVALSLTGCGGDGAPDIDGQWIAQLNSTCALGATFDVPARTYTAQAICQLQGGAFGDELEGGDADFSVPGKVSLVPRHASCASSEHASETDAYSFQGKNLVLGTPDGVIVFEPNNSSGGGSLIVQFGCLDVAGFVAHPIQLL